MYLLCTVLDEYTKRADLRFLHVICKSECIRNTESCFIDLREELKWKGVDICKLFLVEIVKLNCKIKSFEAVKSPFFQDFNFTQAS